MSHKSTHGYVVVSVKENRKEYEHRLIGATALGRPLNSTHQMHHFVGKDNSQGLVLCENDAYHKLLHQRQRVLSAGGDPNTDKICSRCRSIKQRSEFPKTKRNTDGLRCYCRSCTSEINATRHKAAKA